jgi:hypothetical protein
VVSAVHVKYPRSVFIIALLTLAVVYTFRCVQIYEKNLLNATFINRRTRTVRSTCIRIGFLSAATCCGWLLMCDILGQANAKQCAG